MPLSNNIIMMLNDITTRVPDKKILSETDEQLIKNTFNKILESGENYDVDEIESWFENEGSWNHKPAVIRITNISHYVQTRFWQKPKKLNVVSDHDGCGCH
jgi:hypothetical protein